jgi:hypothetical protein
MTLVGSGTSAFGDFKSQQTQTSGVNPSGVHDLVTPVQLRSMAIVRFGYSGFDDVKPLLIFQNPNLVSVSLIFQPNLNAKLGFSTVSAYVTGLCFIIYSQRCFSI